MDRLLSVAGGRKMLNGYIAVVVITVYALFKDPAFWEYASFVLAALGVTSGLVAFEDIRRSGE